MAMSFATDIKPYFSACYRQHMQFYCDLWSAEDVQNHWQDIYESVDDGSMPKLGCPEGVWDAARRGKFLSDFTNWKNANYPP